jgi:ribosomal protein RSM22 (predicted rRNA methylase)
MKMSRFDLLPYFANWLDDSNYNFMLFNELCCSVEEYLFQYLLNNRENALAVASQINNVIKKCDEIDYDSEYMVGAYVIMHFLDRYVRSQVMINFLAKEKIFPLKTFPLSVLDIGTGPGHTLYYLSNFFSLFQDCCAANLIETVYSLDVDFDYVEKSNFFRQWLHSFTEHVNSRNQGEIFYKVPYHHGSFYDFAKLDFRSIKTELRSQLIEDIENEFWMAGEECFNSQYIVDHVDVEWKNRYRYDVLIANNFLTNYEVASGFYKEIISSVYSLRNNGLFIVSGGKAGKYPAIRKLLKEMLERKRFNKKHSSARCFEISLSTNILSLRWSRKIGQPVKL